MFLQLLLRQQESQKGDSNTRSETALQTLAGAAENAPDSGPLPAEAKPNKATAEMERQLDLVRRAAQEDRGIRKPELFDEVRYGEGTGCLFWRVNDLASSFCICFFFFL